MKLIIKSMKTYVDGFEKKRNAEYSAKAKSTIHAVGAPEYNVIFSGNPEWIFLASEFADAQCELLNSMRTHVGTHYCEFEVEEFKQQEFAIVCNSHPH
jgi:hypothetical protein